MNSSDNAAALAVLDTDENGPARAASLQMGDVIVAVDEQKVRGPRGLVAALARQTRSAGHAALRARSQLATVELTLAERT